MDYITKLSKETDPSIYKYRLLNLINNWGRITLFTGKSMRDTYINFETAILAKKNGFNWPCFYYATYKGNGIVSIHLNTKSGRRISILDNGLDFRLLIIKLEEELERLSREYRDEFDKL